MKKISIILYLLSFMVSAQDLKSEADNHYNAKEWNSAIKGYKKYLRKNASDSSAWYRLAFSQYQTAQYEEALKNFDEALNTHFYPGYTLYAKSKVWISMDQKEKALGTLQQAAEKGFGNFRQMETDSEWSALQQDAAFLSIVALAKINAYPCLSDANSRHFEFWVGEWDVFVKGKKVGENSITMAPGGCAIHESYITPGIYSGQSINYYDKLDEKWHQVWVSSAGGVLDYIEIDRTKEMLQFQCDYLNAAGNIVKSRLTFTQNEDGTVRQLFEDSTDGENWTPSFDGLYKPKSE